eukprot:14110703-Heterocapsa_arctica.AAC.1
MGFDRCCGVRLCKGLMKIPIVEKPYLGYLFFWTSSDMSSMKAQKLHTNWTIQMTALVGDQWNKYSGMLFYEIVMEPDEYQEPFKL